MWADTVAKTAELCRKEGQDVERKYNQVHVDAMTVEIERLKAALEHATKAARNECDRPEAAEAEVERLKAEMERLREIAKAYSSMTWEHDMIAAEVCPRVGESLLAAVKRVVYAALAPEKERPSCGAISTSKPGMVASRAVILTEKETT